MFRIFQYIKHFFTAKNEHALHSPFLFNLYLQVVKNPIIKTDYQVELFRKKLLTQGQYIEELDYGTGNKKKQKISSIAKKSLKSTKEYLFLANLVHYLQVTKLLELGTCFGLSAAYLSLGNKNAQLTTLEGNPNRLNIAKQLLQHFPQIKTINGNINQTLAQALSENPNFIYMDANHTYEATIAYFQQITDNVQGNYCIVLDDIYHSVEMLRAWLYIKKQNNAVSLDFFHFGVLIFRKEMRKQTFRLRF